MHVVADRQRLKQVLLNLISNGVKYNRQNGTVRVSIDRSGAGGRIGSTSPIPAEGSPSSASSDSSRRSTAWARRKQASKGPAWDSR